MTRKTILNQARELWETKREQVGKTAFYNQCLDIMNYLERNVKTKGLQLVLYKDQFNYMQYLINKVK